MKPRVFDLLINTERRVFDNSYCYIGVNVMACRIRRGWNKLSQFHVKLFLVLLNKLSQFHVKLFLVLLKCNTLIKLWLGMEYWETCVFFLFFLFPLLLPSKWKGSGIWQHICNKKVHFTSKKLPYTLIQCEPRQRVDHKAYQYSAVFGENQEVSDQLHLRKVPSVYSTCFKIFFFTAFCYFVQRHCW